MSVELTSRYLAGRARSLAAWTVGLWGFSLLIVAIWPTVRDSDSFAAAVDDYPDALKEFLGGQFDLTSGAGFVNAELYSLMLPVLLAFVAVGIGASMGGDQESGLMDLILANPVSRLQVLTAKVVAMLVAVTALALAVGLVFVVFDPIVDLDIGWSNMAAATVATVLVVAFHGLVAALVGSATGSRAAAIGVSVAVFAAGYVLNGLGGIVEWLEPVRPFSPHHHAVGSSPLIEGWDVWSMVVLTVICGAAYAASAVAFERRDIT